MTTPVLQLRGLSHSYGARPVLDEVDLEISAGSVHALLGPNGAGKTTLLSLVTGLVMLQRGEIYLFGERLGGTGARHKVALVGQETAVYPTLTVRENLEFFRSLGSGAERSSIETCARRLSIDRLLHRRAGTLSGGERRRLHFAGGLVSGASLLLLDEPTVGADIEARDAILSTVREIALDGRAVCYTSHYLAEIEQLDCRVSVLARGRIRASGTAASLIERFAEAAVEVTFADNQRVPYNGPGRWTDANHLRIPCREPTLEMTAIIDSLGPARAAMTGTRIVRPNLETAYRSIVESAESAERAERAEGP